MEEETAVGSKRPVEQESDDHCSKKAETNNGETTKQKNETMSQEKVYRFEVVGEDCFVDLRPDNTLIQLMEIVCREWLNEARNGDGGLYDHLWRMVSPNNTLHVGPFDCGAMFNEFGDYAGESVEEAGNSTSLASLSYLQQPGATFRVEYDMGSTSHFKIQLKSIEVVSSQDAQACPRRYVSAGTALSPFVPPAGTPNLNERFPYANKLLFQSSGLVQWILMFPMNENCAAAVEAGPNAMGDVIFCPCKFGSVKEFLVALDLAGRLSPKPWTRADAFARLLFPLKMTCSNERKYNEFKEGLDAHKRKCEAAGANAGPMGLGAMSSAGLSEEDIYRMFGPEEAVVRVTETDMSEHDDFDFGASFPQTSAAHDGNEYRWISYRRGKMQICKGEDTERGIPRAGGVLASTNTKISSLNEFFCVAEALWASIN